MECCIGHNVGEEERPGFDFDDCPVDTTIYNWAKLDSPTQFESMLGDAGANEISEDKIRAYVPESLMCDGRSSQEGTLNLQKHPNIGVHIICKMVLIFLIMMIIMHC